MGIFFYIFFHSEATRNTSQNISTLSSGSASIQNPPRHHIFSHVLKPDKLKGRISGEIMEIFHTIEYTSFELLGFYKYRVIKQNVHGDIFGQTIFKIDFRANNQRFQHPYDIIY